LCVGPYSVRHDGDGPRPPRVENGSVGVVAAVDAEADRVQVRFDEPGRDPRLVSIDQAAWRARREAGERRVPALRLAYASGTLPAQGATVRAAVVLVGREVDDRSSTYVGEARGIERHSVHAARENLGAEGGDEQRRLRYAERIAASRSRSAPARAAADELDPSVRISFKRRDTEPVPRLPWRAE